ncbi:MAG TPA: MmcQ/YjbR family DNA-binding protein [Candidatus Dormibacteraeota bacterium]|nr:MmcQ/YjbR family DNA-binding protein [Candidatus Dormibacteraeota bacterium]
MTAGKFRTLALSIPGASESAHMAHPDFRLDGRVFATLGYPDEQHAIIKLSPEQQANFIDKTPEVFSPSAGAWGRRGATSVRLASAPVRLIRAALQEARRHAMRE